MESSTSRVERIKKSWQEQKEIKNIMLFLQSHEVNTTHATKIFKTYGSDSISVVQENPYRLADDIWGIGFKTADMIAEKLGIEKGRFIRLRSGLFYTLNKLAEDGHCYGDREQLIKKAVELLEVDRRIEEDRGRPAEGDGGIHPVADFACKYRKKVLYYCRCH